MRYLPLTALIFLVGCDPQTIVTTTVTAPTPITFPTATPTATGSCAPTATCPNPCAPGVTCTGGGGGIGGDPSSRLPEIFSFDADTRRISKGAAAVLRWEIGDQRATVRIDPNIGSVSPVGFLLVFPVTTTTYTLTARNNLGTVQRQLTIVVFSAET